MMLLFLVLTCLSYSTISRAQAVTAPLRVGEAVERTIKRGEAHAFNVSLKEDDFLQIAVDQRGIDVVVRVFSPDGKSLGEFDSPTGASGQEGVSLVAHLPGLYRIDVSPLEQQENTASGRYEIRILDLRPATTEELNSAKSQETSRARGLALLLEVANSLQQIRLPETRVRMQIQAAQLLWVPNEKLARKLVEEAIAGVNEYIASVEIDDPNYYQKYQTAVQIRNEVIVGLAARDPELALVFLRSTRILTDPNAGQVNGQPNPELQLELSLATQIAVKDPKRALQIAEENLKKGYSYNLIETLGQLKTVAPDSAARLAGDMATRLQGENLLKNQEASNLAVILLRMAASSASPPLEGASGPDASRLPLLSEQQYRDLFSKAVSAALSYMQSSPNTYSPERNAAQNILASLKPMTEEMERYVPGKAAAVDKTLEKLNTPVDPQGRLAQQYQNRINNGSLTAALEAAGQAPPVMRDQFYQQVAVKAAAAGDFTLARQILTEHVSNPVQRRQALNNLDQQAVYSALNNGKIDEALRNVNSLRTPRERAVMLVQIVNQMGSNQKKAILLDLLDQARGLIGGTGRAQDQEQMFAMFEIARIYLRLEPKRGFEMLEPIVDQFNEMSAAAVSLDGFGQQYFQNGELLMQNGNSLGSIASELILVLGSSAVSDFDRAKAVTDKIQLPEVRLLTCMAIAQQTINQETNEGVSFFPLMHR
jgi:hypothetical protein